MDIDDQVKQLNNATENGGGCVLYVMSRDQRVHDNEALLKAQSFALKHKLPLAVVFCLMPKVGKRSREQYQWMLTGLHELEKELSAFNIPFMMLIGDPRTTLMGMVHHTKPAVIFFDMNPLRGPRVLQNSVAQAVTCPVLVVDTHNIVPVWHVSQKQEYSARTIRTKIQRLIPSFLAEPSRLNKHPYSWPGIVKTMTDLSEMIKDAVQAIPSSGQKLACVSGEKEAHKILHEFIRTRLDGYAVNRNDPSLEGQSELSPYLHFGYISRLRVALEVEHVALNNDALRADADVFLEELIVRSALSDNFCYYNSSYDTLAGAPDWAQKTLAEHASDSREFMYSYKQFEEAQTHDKAWNAAQLQLVRTGKMHGYMRMYWAKKVLEWSRSPDQAIEILIRLNDFYSLDGGDPNGYVGILWSVAGLHDRPWFKRSVYGTIRYMNYNGLKRKFKIENYIEAHSV